ncbi:MAG: hypothetical protein AAF203_01045 [Pseudomonadota bacterium]
MRVFLISMLVTFGFHAFGSSMPGEMSYNQHSEGFAIGVGLGVENDYDNATVLDIKTPTLFHWGESRFALVLSVESKDVGGSVGDEDFSILPIHLMIDWSTPTYKDLIRTYMRLGAGTVLVDEVNLFPEDQFFNVQYILGLEIVAAGNTEGFGAFFLQAMANVPGITNPPTNGSEIFDGTTLSLGYRLYF